MRISDWSSDVCSSDLPRHGVLLPARRQRAGRESVLLARHRHLRHRGADRLGLCADPGLRADHGADVCGTQPRHRRALHRDRSAGGLRGMIATLRHIRYVLTENPITLFAFSLFALLILCAVFGPWIAPYDPLTTRSEEHT